MTTSESATPVKLGNTGQDPAVAIAKTNVNRARPTVEHATPAKVTINSTRVSVDVQKQCLTTVCSVKVLSLVLLDNSDVTTSALSVTRLVLSVRIRRVIV